MRKWIAAIAVAGLSLSVGLPFAAAAAPPAPTPVAAPPCSGRCHYAHVPLPAGVHVTSNRIQLLLPQGYAKSKVNYPVIYALCGAAGDDTEWTTHSDLQSFTAPLKAIFVMPDCGGLANVPGWYSNWANGEYQWETYYIHVLMPWVNRHLRTLRHDNAIIGLSMGGYGALALAARHPTLFKAVGSFSGLLDTQEAPPAISSGGFTSIWGDQSKNSANWTAHNPTALAPKLKGMALFITCGTGGPTSSVLPNQVSAGVTRQVEETYLFQTHLPFIQALVRHHVPYTANIYAGGEHTWPYFQYAAHWALPRMMGVLGRPHRA